MKYVIVALILTITSGCAGVATVVSCGAEAITSYPPGKTQRYLAKVSVKTDSSVLNDEAIISCKPLDNYCAGGSWYTKWEMDPKERQRLRISLDSDLDILIETPNCYGLSHSVDRGDQYYSYWGYPVAVTTHNQEKLLIHSENKKDSLLKHNISHLGLEVTLVE